MSNSLADRSSIASSRMPITTSMNSTSTAAIPPPSNSKAFPTSSSSSSKGKGRSAVFCDVVVEGMTNVGGNWDVPQELYPLLGSLGTQLKDAEKKINPPGTVAEAFASTSKANSAGSVEKLQNLLREFLDTERSYVKRLEVLYNNYAKPLKAFAKRPETAVISKFDANQMFSNIDRLYALNAQFLQDFEKCTIMRQRDWGKTIMEHMSRFAEPTAYPTYLRNAEQGRETMRKLLGKSKNSGLAEFADRTKATSDASIDLSGLLMAPVQRVPLYILLLENMVRVLPGDSLNTPYLVSAINHASSIALCETTEAERKAAIMWSLQRAIEGFPPALYSAHRYFIDSIDVIDCPIPPSSKLYHTSKSSPMLTDQLPCTLFLFSDTLLIAKRPYGSVGGKNLAGLDDLSQLDRAFASAGRTTPSKSKTKSMTYKGYVDSQDICVSDVSNEEFYMYIPNPPHDQTDRWANRHIRRFVVDSSTTSETALGEKTRFFEQLWKSQAKARLIEGKSITMMDDHSSQGPVTFWNIYERRDYLMAKKAKMVLQLDVKGESDELSLGIECAPDILARIVYVDKDQVEYSIRDRSNGEQPVIRQVMPAVQVPRRTALLLLEYGLYDVPPKTQYNKANKVGLLVPHSKGASARPSQFNIGTMSKHLFGGGSSGGGSSNGSASGNAHRRSRSAASKSSTLDSHTTAHSYASFGTKESPSTAATSVASDTAGGNHAQTRLMNNSANKLKKRSNELEVVQEAPRNSHRQQQQQHDVSPTRSQPKSQTSADDIMTTTASMPECVKKESVRHKRHSSVPLPDIPNDDEDDKQDCDDDHDATNNHAVFATSPRDKGFHDDELDDSMNYWSPSALSRTPSRPRGPRQIGQPSPVEFSRYEDASSSSPMLLPSPNRPPLPSLSHSPSSDLSSRSSADDKKPLPPINEKQKDQEQKEQRQPLQQQRINRTVSNKWKQHEPLGGPGRPPGVENGNSGASSRNHEEPRKVSGQKRALENNIQISPIRKRPSVGTGNGNGTSPPPSPTTHRSGSKSPPKDLVAEDTETTIRPPAQDDSFQSSSASTDEASRSINTIRELQTALNSIKTQISHQKQQASSSNIRLSRSPCSQDLQSKFNKMMENGGNLDGVNGQNFDLSELETWLAKASNQLRDLELRWLDQVSKEEEIHNGVYILTDKLSKLETERKQMLADIERYRKERDDINRIQSETEAENFTLYESFNQELERLFQESTLPQNEAYTALSERVIESQTACKAAEMKANDLTRELTKERSKLKTALKILQKNGLVYDELDENL